jgi:hypothetical protein
MLAALACCGFAIAPRLTTSAAMRAKPVRRRDRWVDTLWAPFAVTGKILASFFRNIAHTGATTVGGAATDRGVRASARTDDHRSR